MAINPADRYPGKTAAPDAAYPYGAARNVTVSGDGTGTPWEAALVNDMFGFFQSILGDASVAPSGDPDSVSNPEYLNALKTIMDGRFPSELKDLTNAEIQQLQNINGVTISNAQWAYLGGLNQALTTTSNVTFNTLATVGQLFAGANGSNTIHGVNTNAPALLGGYNAGLHITGQYPAVRIQGSAGDWNVAVGSNGRMTFRDALDRMQINGAAYALDLVNLYSIRMSTSQAFTGTSYKSIHTSYAQLLLGNTTAAFPSTESAYLFGGGGYDGTNHYRAIANIAIGRIAVAPVTSDASSIFSVTKYWDGDYTGAAGGAVNTPLTLMEVFAGGNASFNYYTRTGVTTNGTGSSAAPYKATKKINVASIAATTSTNVAHNLSRDRIKSISGSYIYDGESSRRRFIAVYDGPSYEASAPTVLFIEFIDATNIRVANRHTLSVSDVVIYIEYEES